MRRHRKSPTSNVVERMRTRRRQRRAALPPVTAPNAAPVVSAKGNTAAWRIAEALQIAPAALAKKIGVREVDLIEMFKGRSVIVAGHPAWRALGALVDKQIGLLLGVQAEIQAKRELDAKRLRERMEKSRHG